MPAPDQEFSDFALTRSARLYRSAYLLCGNAHTAEDLVQETLAKVFVAWKRIDDPVAYAHVALTRTFLSQARRRSWSERPVAEVPDRVQASADLGARAELLDALDQLDRHHRVVLVLRFLEDLSVDQVAEVLGIRPGAVRTRTHRALSRVRGVLTDHDAEEALR